ncbi:MAG: cohesin domain-containing protein [Anaerolineaceae bacterium]|nr:cohesin domain-containing protein [Anaerolineaceae bacterium]
MNRKSLVTILVLVGMIASLFGATLPVFAAGTSLSIGPVNANQGDTINLPIVINTSTGVRAYQFDLAFDPSRVKVNSISDGGFLATAGAGSVLNGNPTTINNTAGTANGTAYFIAGGTGASASGTGNLAVVNFTILSAAPNGKAALTLSNVEVDDVNAKPITGVTLTNKWIQVGPGPNLQITGLGFTPHGTGQTFDVSFTVVNNGGAASDPDVAALTLTNAAPASQNFTVPSLNAGTNQAFSLTNVALNSGAQNAVATVLLQNVNVTASATYSPVSAAGTVPVNASLGAYLTINPPTAFNFGTLKVGANTASSSFNVMCNTNYAVDVSDAGTTAWHMTEFDGTNFKTLKLADAMHMTNPGQSYDVTAGSASPRIISGGVAGQSGDAGQNFQLTATQQLHFADPLLPSGETYHLVLTFNAYVTM